MSFHHFRKVDLGMFLTIMTIIGVLYAGFAKPEQWDDAAAKVKTFEPRIDKNEKDIAELRGVNTAQFALIVRELDGIHRELRRR